MPVAQQNRVFLTIEATTLPTAPQSLTGARFGLASFAVCLLLLAFAPLAFGSVLPWSYGAIELLAGIGLMLWLISQITSSRLVIRWTHIHTALAALVGIVAVQAIFNATAYWYVTYTKLLQYLAFLGLFVALSETLRAEQRVQRFALFASLFGFAVALFAILQDFTSNGAIYWMRVPRYQSSVFGPYVDHAHYAGLMEMLIPFPLVWCMWREQATSKRILLGGMAAVMIASLVLARSRGGILVFATQLVVLGGISVARKRGRTFAFASIVAIVVLVAALIIIDSSQLLSGIGGDLQVGRGPITRDTLKMVPGHWLLGWGAGTFAHVFPQFRSFYVTTYVNEAHNDFLQTLVETGVFGLAAFLSFAVGVLTTGFANLRRVRLTENSVLRLAATTGFLGLLVHGFFDFNLQIPANAAWFFALAAVAICKPEIAIRSRQVER